MRIGLDLDNTVIDYGSLFYEAGLETGWISGECGRRHDDVRCVLQQEGHEDRWVTLQGVVYGPRLAAATPYPGVAAFLRRCERQGATVYILSHKTPRPAMGPGYDLRAAATQWLADSGLVGDGPTGLSLERVSFFATRAGKVAAVGDHNLHWFVDDLPAVFQEPEFPASTGRILFDPYHIHDTCHGWRRANSWPDVEQLVFAP